MVEQEEEAAFATKEIFSLSGPHHLTFVHWGNVNHQRSVAASLVQGVYVLERDRQTNRQGLQSYAPPWWEFFHFDLRCSLIDDVDNSIFGAIYAFKRSAFNLCYAAEDAPLYVIAFRGTIKKQATISRDLRLDFLCIKNKLQESSRYRKAMKEVREMVCVAGAGNIWLTGHSLGSAMALLAGKTLTRTGHPIETYLFNPPFISIPLECIKNQKLKDGIHLTTSVVKAGLTAYAKNKKSVDDPNPIHELSYWQPRLFVNPSDKLCSGYIGYFEQRKKMKEIEGGMFGEQNSCRSLIYSAFGKDSEPFHLIPCAYLTVNRSEFREFKRCHGIHQWWSPDDSKFDCSLHQL